MAQSIPVALILTFSVVAVTATPSTSLWWTKVRDASETKLLCVKLNKGAHHTPRYDKKYSSVEQCQNACLKLVPGCDAVNFQVSTNKCGFEQCNGHIRFGGAKGSNSYIFGPPTTTAARAASSKLKWTHVRFTAQAKLNCDKLNKGPHHSPRYDSPYSTVGQCQNACSKLVAGCDAVNYQVSTGKCGFEQCNGHLRIGGNKGFDSYVLGPYDTTTPTTESPPSTTHAAATPPCVRIRCFIGARTRPYKCERSDCYRVTDAPTRPPLPTRPCISRDCYHDLTRVTRARRSRPTRPTIPCERDCETRPARTTPCERDDCLSDLKCERARCWKVTRSAPTRGLPCERDDCYHDVFKRRDGGVVVVHGRKLRGADS